MAEGSKNENLDREKSPETIASEGLSRMEGRDALDPVLNSEWNKGSKLFIKERALDALAVSSLLFTVAFRTCKSLVEFAIIYIKKKGNISYKEGGEIGEKIFDFDSKNPKK